MTPLEAGSEHNLLGGRTVGDPHPQYVLKKSQGLAGGGLPAGTTDQTLRHSGTAWVADSNLKNTGSVVLVGQPADTTPKRLSSEFNAGSSVTSLAVIHHKVDTDYDGKSGAATQQLMKLTVDALGGVLSGVSALTLYGVNLVMQEDTSDPTGDGHSRSGFRCEMNHTGATSGQRAAFDSKGGTFDARDGSTNLMWRVDPVPALVDVVEMVDGDVAWRDKTNAQWTVDQNAFDSTHYTVHRVSSDSALRELRGIINGGGGKWIMFINVGTLAFIVKHQHGTPAAGDRIITATALDVTVAGGSSILLRYDATDGRWRHVRLV